MQFNIDESHSRGTSSLLEASNQFDATIIIFIMNEMISNWTQLLLITALDIESIEDKIM